MARTALDFAKDPTTSGADLGKIYHETVNRLWHDNSDSYTSLIKALALNPSTPFYTLARMSQRRIEMGWVVDNPVLPLLRLEDTALFDRYFSVIVVESLKARAREELASGVV